jgi:hypothetical protein
MSGSEARVRWAQRLAEQEASGMNVATWCRDQGIDPASLYGWRKRLNCASSESSVTFIPVSPEPDPLKLDIRVGGVLVEVTPGFNRILLREVLDFLERRPC